MIPTSTFNSEAVTPALTWKSCMPVVLEAAQGKASVGHDELGEAVAAAAVSSWPEAVGAERGGMPAARFHAARAARRAVHLGFLSRVKPGEFELTAQGEAWLAENHHPLSEEAMIELQEQLERSKTFGFEIDELKRGFFWVIRTGSQGEREEVSLRDGAAYPGMYLGEEANVEFDRAALRKKIVAFEPEIKKGAIKSIVSQLNRIRSHMEVGDLVLMPSKLRRNTVYVGRVAGEYEYHADESDPDMRHMVPVDWREEPIERTDLGVDLQNKIGSMLTICRVSKNNALARVESVIAGNGDFEMAKYNKIEQDNDEELDLTWVPFFTEFADKLRAYADDRTELMEKLAEAREASGRPSLFDMLFTWKRDGNEDLATDVDPFSILATVNRGITVSNKKAICEGFKEALGLEAEVPTGFSGVPEAYNMKSKFETHKDDAGNPEFYERMWKLFIDALDFADAPNDARREAFVESFKTARKGRRLVSYTMALFWIRPYAYLPVDGNTRGFLSQEEVLGSTVVEPNGNVSEYMDTLEAAKEWLAQGLINPADFVGLSWKAWKRPETVEPDSEPTVDSNDEPEFTLEQVIDSGCFLPKERLEEILERWREKKNLILQGPPGTGKTWLARKLGQVLSGTDSDENITVVQFHPSTSYEDFIQGYRPSGDGRLALAEGPFLELLQQAFENEDMKYVMVIEEINRGNPAQIFGEMLTLLEADKRSAEHGIRTLYGDKGSKQFLPPNFYVIGTMNQADRSLAMVDMALRRRFAFVTLKPELGDVWMEFCATERGRDRDALREIAARINAVNAQIAADPSLGAAYEIGHSFVTPVRKHIEPSYDDTMRWFQSVVETDVQPLLEEYWFDDSAALEMAMAALRGV